MAHNIMRVDSVNDRYVTETMIDLNLNLNEEIDFDFFDNVGTPSKEIETRKNDTLCHCLSRPCSPQCVEDDDDVQISPPSFSQNIHSTTDSIEELEKNAECVPFENINAKLCDDVLVAIATESHSSAIDKKSEPIPLENVKSFCKDTFCLKPVVSVSQIVSNKGDKYPLESELRESCLNQASLSKSSESFKEDALQTLALNGNNKEFIKSSKNHDIAIRQSHFNYDGESTGEIYKEDTSSKCTKSAKTEALVSGYDSDEGCLLEGSDSDNLLLGVHTLTIIPRENDEESLPCTQTTGTGEETRMRKNILHSTSCEKTAITARSSSGYSSASCKAHGCIDSRGNTSKEDSRQSSKMKMHTPDMDELMKSFRKMQSSPRFSFADKYCTSKKTLRRNMSFSNEELKRIERENAILLNKIVLQQRTRPPTEHKYKRRVTSNAINRAQQSKKIETDNEVCFHLDSFCLPNSQQLIAATD